MRRWVIVWMLLLSIGVSMPAAAQEQVQYAICPPDYSGYLPPRLRVGMIGDILAGGVPNRVRAAPSRGAEFLFQIEPGTTYTIIGGPACSDSIVWWRVDYNGRVGWTAESSTSDRIYYLQPSDATATRRTFAPSGRPAINGDRLSSLRMLDSAGLPPGRFAIASYANLMAVLPAGGRLLLYNPSNLDEPLAETVPEDVSQLVAMSPGGLRLALGLIAPETQAHRVVLYRYDPTFVTPLEPIGQPFELSQALPLLAFAYSQPYLLTGHGDFRPGDTDDEGELIIWNSETGEEVGRLPLPFAPTEMVIHDSGLVAAVSARAGDQVETLLVDLESQVVKASVPAFGPLAFTAAPDAGLGRLLIGGLDGTVAVYNLLSAEQSNDLRPSRLERLGTVEVFVGLPNLRVSVTALAAAPAGDLVAVGSGVYFDGALPEAYAGAVAFIDLRTGLVSAEGLRSLDWGTVYGLAFSADGSTLIVGATDRDGAPKVLAFGVDG